MRRPSDLFQVLVFLGLTFGISSVFHWRIIFHGGLEANLRSTLFLMWTPGIVGLSCSLLFGHRLGDIGFRRTGWRELALAYAVPMAAACLVFLLLWISGIGRLGIRSELLEQFGSRAGVLRVMLLVLPTIGVLSASLRALGEEIGWRGFLHSRLRNLGAAHPYMVTGLIWSFWHLPIILFSDYATSDRPMLSAALFTLMATSLSVFLGWQRDRAGSIWPAALTHGAHNAWIQGVYPAFLEKGPLDAYFGGESGVFLAALYAFLAAAIVRRGR